MYNRIVSINDKGVLKMAVEVYLNFNGNCREAGVKEEEYTFIEELAAANLVPDFITIDIAHGHSNAVIRMIQHIKKHLPKSFVIAGNVGTLHQLVHFVSIKNRVLHDYIINIANSL